MAITLRQNKTTALSHAELDGNFIDLDGRIAGFESDVTALQTDVGTLQTDVAAIPSVTDGTTGINVNSVTTSFVSTSGLNASTNITSPVGDLTTINTNDIDVTGKIVIGKNSVSGSNGVLNVVGTNYDDIKFTRVASSVGPRVSNWIVTDYVSDPNVNAALQTNMGAGIWTQIKTTDVDAFTGGLTFSISNNGYVDNANFKTNAYITTYDYSSGTLTSKEVALFDTEEIKFQKTNRVEIDTQIPMRFIETHADDLPSPAVKGDVLFLGFDANSNYHAKLIYFNGTQWNFVHDDSQVAT